MNKKITISVIAVVAIVGLFFVFSEKTNEHNSQTPTPEPSFSFSILPTSSSMPSKSPVVNPTQTPGITPIPYDKFPAEASCALKGEIKFLTNSIFDNQDALFSYIGIDHPGRIIKWTVTPSENLEVGPNLFARLQIPDGQSLISVVLPENPIAKRYELTATVTYGRIVDGNIKIFTKDCSGKTIVTLP